MREQNPAITLYQQYRNIVSWRGEHWVTKIRQDYKTYAEPKPDQVRLTREEIEERIQAGQGYYSNWQKIPLNYRMSLRIMGLSDAHLGERLFDDLEDWEPIIQLEMRTYGTSLPLFTIWPDGKFHFEEMPSRRAQVMPQFVTFLRTSYAAGRRVWLVSAPSMNGHYPWVHVDEKDWKNPIPYVRNFDLIQGVFYRIVPAENGHWKFQGVESPNIVTHERLLDEGYRVAEKRYDRYRRAAEKVATAERKRTMIAMYVPRQGLLTGDDAVNRFAQSMRVYEPS